MQFFGLVSLIITAAVMLWWVSINMGQVAPVDGSGTSEGGTYQEALNQANGAVDALEK